MSRSQQQVTFRASDDPRHPFEAVVDGKRWTVRINEFPEAPSLYTLIVDGEDVEELIEWPAAWSRPSPDDDPLEKAEYDRDLAQFERTRGIAPSKLVK
jgi:hypothetical protein